ncbi:class D sortase [Clostridium ganghwense]|uniref:Class D sortase n=1 Tax=Clostridium ganghwense TaxID=312089 RepID=A0ABT4CTT0_9CLOT|nr:class D sortase [Clostridium ganghwense]MCY6371369.1 class D sortase [Clostridium ganghwense]
MKKIFAVGLIVLGIIVMMYPKIRDGYSTYKEKKVLKEYEQSLRNIGTLENEISDDNLLKNEENKKIQKIYEDATILKIDKINLYMPILEGETKENLRTTVCHMKNTGKLGEVGNYAIAGHRCYSYGRHFNRLDEVEVGDELIVFSMDKEYKYKVFKKFIVKPEEVGVLEGNGKDKMITLITCTPIRVATHRLIIQGKLESVSKRVDSEG